ncbi:MAG: prepilin-type N-terminal cleavage/methylation domain-containing protein [Candidatus Omnitrophota bacterium]|jgi:prepilin-type N-terminal cleavage/methylation domain-containing protein
MKKRSQKGFTLSELLLASAILVFVLAGLLLLFVKCLVLNESNRNLSVALSHAQYIMENIRDADFAQLESDIGGGTWDLTAGQIQTTPHNLPVLNNETINTAVTQSGDPLGVEVLVRWDDRGQRQRSVDLETLITTYR